MERVVAGERDASAAAATAGVVDRAGSLALAATVTAWAVTLWRMAGHRIYVSHDSLISYAHAWFIANRLWHGHGLPVRMPVVGHGDAFAYPYGFVPWTAAAVLRPALGDWSTTLVLVAGTVGLMIATFWAFPELRHGWAAVAVLVEPAMVSSPIIGQIPFVTAAALLMVAIGAWRRERPVLAVVAAGLAQLTHPATVLPLAALLVAGRLPWERSRQRLLACYAVSVLIALPAVVLLFVSPVMGETTAATKIAAFAGNIAPRSLVLLVPIALLLLQRRTVNAFVLPGLVVVLVVANLVMWPLLGMPWAWRALGRRPDQRMARFTATSDFHPGAIYRVLRVDDGKIGMYQLLRGGGRLDSEFFPESIDRRSWTTGDDYVAFLHGRAVDYVMLWRGYDGVFHTNEHRLLQRLSAGGCRDGTAIARVRHTHDFDLYAVRSPCPLTSPR